MTTAPGAFTELRIPRDAGNIYVRSYAGAGPALVLMHGFPDNLHIWDDLVPHLIAAGRRLVTFDFLGFGASDKPTGEIYSFAQQLGDLKAVADGLDLQRIVPVAHDSSGMTALNYVLERPQRVDSVIMLNSAYNEDSTVLWPEMITLFATHSLQALARTIAQNPAQFGWLLTWQQAQFANSLPDSQREHFNSFIGPLISANFLQKPGAGAAFVQMATQFFQELERNSQRLPRLKSLDTPVKLIWGKYDPYFPVAVAERRRAHLANASLTVIPAGHWLQADEPAQVARAMLT